MSILVLGAGGFIGSHLVERLLDGGRPVAAVDLSVDKLARVLGRPGLRVALNDIREPAFDLDGFVRGADLVIDLIAYANPGLYVRMPLEVFRLNFEENLRIARACARHGKRLIQFSSCEVYGMTPAAVVPDKLLDPDDPGLATFSEDRSPCLLGPVGRHRWIYASAKQLLERVLHAMGLAGELDYTIVRPFNFLGPRIDFLPSEGDGVPRVFSYFMEALLRGEPMKLVDGGRRRRCYTDIGDAVEAIARIVDDPGGVCGRQIFNIGSPANEVRISELAALMREIYAERLGVPESALPRPVTVSAEEFYGSGYQDSDRRIPDIAKARRLLGWEPRVGLRDTLVRAMGEYLPPFRTVPAHDAASSDRR
ncbi:MAG: NAD-dependent epimerase/dehydratase family protein [Candidatus Aminicenantes bacterium]|nr:NAD-dependent epimerase/dehydratase family protein [Candidatus Aminicenantes bacterium]